MSIQLIDLQLSAYALRHDPGTPETNRAKVIQVEIEEFAKDAHNWPTQKLDWITDVIVKPACQQMGIDAAVYQQRFGDGDGLLLASKSSPIRINDKATWYAYNGLLGHQHAPGVSGNEHWDPGRLDIAYISKRITQ